MGGALKGFHGKAEIEKRDAPEELNAREEVRLNSLMQLNVASVQLQLIT